MDKEIASNIVLALLGDLEDRAGFDESWEAVEPETRYEIIEDWVDIVLTEGSAKPAMSLKAAVGTPNWNKALSDLFKPRFFRS